MKATGRRAWRQAGQRFRKAEKRIGFYPPNSVGLFERRHWRASDEKMESSEKQFPPRVEMKPFTARSLVGMTMGARKRRWAKDYDALPQFGRFSKTMSMLRAYGVYPKEGNPLAQRLRPCPGCWNCQTTWQQSSIYSQTAVMHRHGCSHDDPSGLCCFGETVPVKMECDGSGVLPARKQR